MIRHITRQRLATLGLLALLVVASDGIAGSRLVERADGLAAFLGRLASPTTKAALHDLHSPGSGEQVLPQRVQNALRLLRTNAVAAYRVSPGLAADALVSQRMIEGAFPRLKVASARHLLSLASDELPGSCKPIAREHEVTLAVCD